MLSIGAWLLGSRIGRWLLAASLGAAALGFALLKAFTAGEAKARLQQSQATVRAVQTRVQINDQVSKLSHSDRRAALAKWVRN